MHKLRANTRKTSNKRDSGDIYIHEKKVTIKNVRGEIKNGVCYLSEDRRRDGMLLKLSIQENASVSSLNKYIKHIIIDDVKVRDDVEKYNEIII